MTSVAPTAGGLNILPDSRHTSAGGSAAEEPVADAHKTRSQHTNNFSWGPLTLAAAPRCDVVEAPWVLCFSNCWKKLFSPLFHPCHFNAEVCLAYSSLKDKPALPRPQAWLFGSSFALSTTHCNVSHNPTTFIGLVWNRNHETDQSLTALTVLLAKTKWQHCTKYEFLNKRDTLEW